MAGFRLARARPICCDADPRLGARPMIGLAASLIAGRNPDFVPQSYQAPAAHITTEEIDQPHRHPVGLQPTDLIRGEGRDPCRLWAPAGACPRAARKRGPVGRCDTRIGERHFMEVLILTRVTLRRIIAHAGLIVSEFEFSAGYRMPRSADWWTCAND